MIGNIVSILVNQFIDSRYTDSRPHTVNTVLVSYQFFASITGHGNGNVNITLD